MVRLSMTPPIAEVSVRSRGVASSTFTVSGLPMEQRHAHLDFLVHFKGHMLRNLLEPFFLGLNRVATQEPPRRT